MTSTLPNFLVIGAQKAGTTWLLHTLRRHPDVFMPPKEIHFFDKDENYRRGLSWYRQFFEGVEDESAIGEKTPDYCWTNTEGAEGHLPDVHRNVHDVLPDARLIFIVRNPVDRAVSAVNHLYRTRRVSPRYSVDRLLVGDKRALAERHGVIDYGRYHRHIQAYLELFDREQLLILVFEEDVVRNPTEGLAKVVDFLGVDPSYQFSRVSQRENPSGVSKPGLYVRYYLPFLKPIVQTIDKFVVESNFKRTPTHETVQALRSLYEEENEKLFQFLGRRIPSWTRDASAD